MRILHLSTFLQGGAGRAITDLAIAQQTAGHHVAMAVDGGGEPGYGNYAEYLARLEHAGIAIHRLDSTFKRDLARNLTAVEHLGRLCDVGRLDLVHTHAAVPSMIGRLVTSPVRRFIPVVQSMHGWGVSKSAEQAASDVAVMNLVDRVVVPSHASAALLRSLGVARDLVTVVAYGVPDEAAAPLPPTDAAVLDEARRRWDVVLGCVGTIGDRKNQKLVVDALARVRGAVAGCVFVGDGDAAGLIEHARACGVSDRTIVLGYRAAASHYLTQLHACVLASRSEGQPLAILEAFRDRVPVIAAGIPELRELVADRVNGLIFEPEDAEALAREIENTARGAAQALAARARLAYEAKYTVARMVEGYAEVYEQVRRWNPAQAVAS
jgi:L-malate glycosyltransferase